MKVCLIIHSLGIGGMERVASVLANQFSKKENVSVDILLIGRERNVDYKIMNSVALHRPGFRFDDSKRHWHTVRTMWFIRRTINKLKPDSILSFGEVWNNLVCLSLLGTKSPVYVSDRCKPDKSLGIIHDYLRILLYKRTEGIVAQTNYAENFFLKITSHKKIKTIGNPIRFIPLKKNIKKRNEVLTVGRLIATKHHDRLIRSFCEVRKEGWILRIVGGDAQKQQNLSKLKDLIKELQAENIVFLEGEQSSVDQYYQQAKIFAFTSSSEGFPNVIGEALSAGLPVISYDCVAGPSDMIKDGKNGYLISTFDDETFRKKLSKLMEDESQRQKMGDYAKKSVQQFSPAKMSETFYNFISSHI